MIKNSEYTSLKFPEHAEIVIIGLGLAGLSSAYQLSKAGYHVVGFQQFPDSGYQGTSSCSYTRAYKLISGAYPELTKRQPIEKAQWAELERLSGLTILSKFEGALDIGPKNSKAMQFIKNCKHNMGILTPKEIMSRYPAIFVPDDYYGIMRDDARLIDVKNALNALKIGALKYGAKFYYNTKMINFNENTKTITLRRELSDKNNQTCNSKGHQYADVGGATVYESGGTVDVSRSNICTNSIKNSNQLRDSTIKYSKNVVMSLGSYSQQYKNDPNVKVLQVEVITITDPSGMVPCLTVFTRDGGYFYQMPMTSSKNHGSTEMKIGLSGPRCFKKWLKQISYFYPGKQNKVGLSTPCFKLVRTNVKGFDIYNEKSIIWCYGFQGHGFKHGPSIGIDVKNIVDRQSKENDGVDILQNHKKSAIRLIPKL